MKRCDLNYVPLFLPRPTSNWLSVAEKDSTILEYYSFNELPHLPYVR